MGLRDILGRNININKEIRAKYDEISKTYLFKGKDRKNIFMLCLALGHRIGRRTEVKDTVGLLNVSSFTNQDLWMIVAIAVKEKGDLNVLEDPAEIKRIATEYAHTGLYELGDLIKDYGGGQDLEAIIEKWGREGLEGLSVGKAST